MSNLNLQITRDLHTHLSFFTKDLNQDALSIYDYILFPTGKLFRSNLVWKYFCDLKNFDVETIETAQYPDVQLLASAIEIHHAYTLVHDDLPCMDDDDFRRQKPSAHKKYNEWKALLAGDGLLNLSYEILSHIESGNNIKLIKEFSKLCGPKGLILGQYLDLSQNSTIFNFEELITIHELKTSNLFMASMIGASLISGCENEQTSRKIGRLIGIYFQLIDDLTELADNFISTHENAINPWINDFENTHHYLQKLRKDLKNEINSYKNIDQIVRDYSYKTRDFLIQNTIKIEKHIGQELSPIINSF